MTDDAGPSTESHSGGPRIARFGDADDPRPADEVDHGPAPVARFGDDSGPAAEGASGEDGGDQESGGDGTGAGDGRSGGEAAAPVALFDRLGTIEADRVTPVEQLTGGPDRAPSTVADLGAVGSDRAVGELESSPSITVADLAGARRRRAEGTGRGRSTTSGGRTAGVRRGPGDRGPGTDRARDAERWEGGRSDVTAPSDVDTSDPDDGPTERSRRGSGRDRAGREGAGREGRGRGSQGGGFGRSRGAPAELDPDADPIAMAREVCLRLLTDRARTRQELAQALMRKGVPDEAAHTVLDRFDEVGLIDDAAFAGQWVRSRHQHKGLAKRAIAMELRRKGVDDEVAGEALAEVDTESEELRARELVDRKLRTVPADTPEQRKKAAQRLVGMLARKGYGGGIAYRVVREALAAHGAEADELGTDPLD
jgi:regulatory protein